MEDRLPPVPDQKTLVLVSLSSAAALLACSYAASAFKTPNKVEMSETGLLPSIVHMYVVSKLGIHMSELWHLCSSCPLTCKFALLQNHLSLDPLPFRKKHDLASCRLTRLWCTPPNCSIGSLPSVRPSWRKLTGKSICRWLKGALGALSTGTVLHKASKFSEAVCGVCHIPRCENVQKCDCVSSSPSAHCRNILARERCALEAEVTLALSEELGLRLMIHQLLF